MQVPTRVAANKVPGLGRMRKCKLQQDTSDTLVKAMEEERSLWEAPAGPDMRAASQRETGKMLHQEMEDRKIHGGPATYKPRYMLSMSCRCLGIYNHDRDTPSSVTQL